MDPNYEHEFDPNTKGRCKRILKFQHCGEREDFPPHTRYNERHPACPECDRRGFGPRVGHRENFDHFMGCEACAEGEPR